MKPTHLLAALCCLPSVIQANPDVTSREYKLMLQPAAFNATTELSDVGQLLQTAEQTIESAISRNVSGSHYLDHNRTIYFYDTDSCALKAMNYSFRERIENGQSEVTLKYRSPDRYIADFEDLSASNGNAETKLEADIGISNEAALKVVYGHSTKSPNSRTINEMEDINDQFPGFDQDYQLNNSIELKKVGNLTIQEHVYKGVFIDLGQFDAELSVTLWYQGSPSGTPAVAELSFKYEDNQSDYTRKVVNRAKLAFESLQSMTNWTSTTALTKTQFVYQYDTNFCN